MNSPIRLHLVEPQPLLRSRLVESLGALGARVSWGTPGEAVPDGATIVLNIDGHSDHWRQGVAGLVAEYGLRIITTSSANWPLGPTLSGPVLGNLLRPFSASELLEFVGQRLIAQTVQQPDTLEVASVVSRIHGVASRASQRAETGDATPEGQSLAVDSLHPDIRASTASTTELELDVFHPLREMLISAYVDTLAEMLLTLADLDADERRAALRALLIRFADELSPTD
jgi:hypothetical protein